MTQFLANRVVDNIFIGSKFAAEDIQFLEQNQIAHIVNLVEQIVPNKYANSAVQYISFSVGQDGVLLDENDSALTEAVQFIQTALKDDTQVLFQSEYGENRGAVFTAAYLVHRFHWPPNEALQFVACKRPNIKPTQNFLDQLQRFAERRRQKYGMFKNIFQIKAMPNKMNYAELWCRNTFLNYYLIDELEQPRDIVAVPETAVCVFNRIVGNQQNSIRDIKQQGKNLASMSNIFQKATLKVHPSKQIQSKNSQKSVWFRDNLNYSQPDIRCSYFDQQNRPIFRQHASMLFRGQSSSYKNNTITRNAPPLGVQVSSTIPTLGIDYDIHGVHTRSKVDGELINSLGQRVITKAISIMRAKYAESIGAEQDETDTISVKEYEKMLQEYSERQAKGALFDLDDFNVHQTCDFIDDEACSSHSKQTNVKTEYESNTPKAQSRQQVSRRTPQRTQGDISQTKKQPTRRKFKEETTFISAKGFKGSVQRKAPTLQFPQLLNYSGEYAALNLNDALDIKAQKSSQSQVAKCLPQMGQKLMAKKMHQQIFK